MAEKPDDDLLIQALAKPVKAHGEDITELRCRRPTGKDVLELGNPVMVDPFADDPIKTARFDWGVMAPMIARLAGVPMSTLGACEPSDLTTLAWKLAVFLLPRG